MVGALLQASASSGTPTFLVALGALTALLTAIGGLYIGHRKGRTDEQATAHTREKAIDDRTVAFIDDQQAELTEVRKEIRANRAEMEQYRATTITQGLHIAELTQQLLIVKADLSGKTAEHEEQKRENARLKGDLKEARDQITRLEAELKVLRSLFQTPTETKRRRLAADEGGSE
jgi:chromosome segregation ATPase